MCRIIFWQYDHLFSYFARLLWGCGSNVYYARLSNHLYIHYMGFLCRILYIKIVLRSDLQMRLLVLKNCGVQLLNKIEV